ncbi:hypothetical protein Hanom_Chr04g00318901 [Helianthus anomalus]
MNRERYVAKKAEEEELKSRKVDNGIIDTTKETTAENLTTMADKVLMAKELEVDSKSASESTSKVSKSGSNNELGKTDGAKTKSDCKNCMKECKVCSTHAYLTLKKTQDLVEKVEMVEKQILNRDKLMRASNERIKELTEKIEKDKTDVERFKKENEKQINQHLDEIANLKLQFQEATIENERINLNLNNYSSASFVLQHIVPKPIGKNKAGEDVYSDGTGVGYHQVPPPVLNIFSKKQSGLVNEDETKKKTNDIKLQKQLMSHSLNHPMKTVYNLR